MWPRSRCQKIGPAGEAARLELVAERFADLVHARPVGWRPRLVRLRLVVARPLEHFEDEPLERRVDEVAPVERRDLQPVLGVLDGVGAQHVLDEVARTGTRPTSPGASPRSVFRSATESRARRGCRRSA